MPLAEGGTAVRQRTIDRHSSREGIESKGDLVAEVVVGHSGASGHSETLERGWLSIDPVVFFKRHLVKRPRLPPTP